MNKNNMIIDGLKDLYEKNHDAHLGFEKAAGNVVSPNLKAFFKAKEAQRKRFESQLSSELQNYGQDIDIKGSMAGKAHRFWIDMVGTFTGKDEEAVLDACEDGEERAIKEYNDFLEMDNIPIKISEMVRTQMLEIKETKREMNVLEEEYDS